ncbi:tetratricopeptide repeat protein [Lutibaculum baratangense]|uniref:Tetratrico peptide repeat group 5 domain-containing protein n=1 Tax=Lutibaculum baratangense AMV1 TaxID=631454 RepID=V4RPG6_9HYPH|nr:tetratricopeptide repeat protein [Lutibaculum baratangense]ESR27174.1 hypothetical protein N177_0153 [Lutibaculum baratangense AMV1]
MIRTCLNIYAFTLAIAIFSAAGLSSVEVLAQSADELAAQARSAGDAQDHEEAARLFEAAISASPARRREWQRELADQIAYAGRPAEAVPLYRELLSEEGLVEDERRRIERNLAFALLWSGRPEEAAEALSAVVSASPDDEEARAALAEARIAVAEEQERNRESMAGGESDEADQSEPEAAERAPMDGEPAADEPPSPAIAAIAAAREAAGRGANAEAAAAFSRALQLEPALFVEMGIEYADQVAYAGEPGRAVPLYRRALAELPLTPGQRSEVERKLAFALLWAGEFGAAASAWRPIVRANPRDDEARGALADAYLGGARQAAGAARSGEAVRLFERAFQVAPARRRELLREYADQVLYSGRPADAIPLFHEVLSLPGLAPVERRRGLLGLARGHAWSGDHEAAVPVYTELLEGWPRDTEARIGRGQSFNTLVRHERALADFEVALAVEPLNAEALRGAAQSETSMERHIAALDRLEPLLATASPDPRTLIIAANARRHLGRPDLAEDLTRQILENSPEDAAARALLDLILLERRPLTRFESRYVTRSDELSILTLQGSHEVFLNRGLTSLGLQARFASYRGDDFPDVEVASFGVFARHRVNDWLEARTSVLLNQESEPGGDDLELTHETSLAFLMSDTWRAELQAVRRYADEDPAVFVNDVLADDFGGAVFFTPRRDVRASARAYYSDYTDGNERIWGQVDAAYNVRETGFLWLGARATAFDFAEDYDFGYWNPGHYRSLHGTIHAYGAPAPGWWLDVQGALGWAWSEFDGDGLTWSAEARLSRDLTRHASLELYGLYQYSEAREDRALAADDDGDPFWRGTLGAQLRLRW